MENVPTKKASGRIWAGIILLGIGGILLLSTIGFPFPRWLFRWPVILIIIGVFDGLRNGFRGGVWFVLLLIGGFFLLDGIAPEWNMGRFTWPLIIISVGAGLLLRPNRNRYRFNDRPGQTQYPYNGGSGQDMYQAPPVSDTVPTKPPATILWMPSLSLALPARSLFPKVSRVETWSASSAAMR